MPSNRATSLVHNYELSAFAVSLYPNQTNRLELLDSKVQLRHYVLLRAHSRKEAEAMPNPIAPSHNYKLRKPDHNKRSTKEEE